MMPIFTSITSDPPKAKYVKVAARGKQSRRAVGQTYGKTDRQPDRGIFSNFPISLPNLYCHQIAIIIVVVIVTIENNVIVVIESSR